MFCTMKLRTAALIAAVGLAAGLSACETATPYQPLASGSRVYGGFSDQRLDTDHYRVTFAGNSVTSRATVENYLLYRAADLTVKAGYDWFQTDDHHTDKQQSTYTTGYGPWGYGAFDPYWNVWGPRYGPYGRRGFWGGPYWDPSFETETIQRFQASADIVMGHGPKPSSAQAFNAHEVLTNLGPHIVMPK
jgi:hypothetical protein